MKSTPRIELVPVSALVVYERNARMHSVEQANGGHVNKTNHPKHMPSAEQRKQVEAMAAYGIPELDIARVIGISHPTLRKWYLTELQTGHIKANSMVAQSLYQKAMGSGQGAVTACIFWLKCRAGWVEPKPWDEPQIGRKELQQQAAATAGGVGTDWANDLEIDSRAN
jgi:hypothetical protein